MCHIFATSGGRSSGVYVAQQLPAEMLWVLFPLKQEGMVWAIMRACKLIRINKPEGIKKLKAFASVLGEIHVLYRTFCISLFLFFKNRCEDIYFGDFYQMNNKKNNKPGRFCFIL
jgi:hypothetical protein